MTVTKSGYIGVSGIWNGDAQEICIVLQEAAENPDIDVEIPSSWRAFRGDRSNNGVVDAPVPKKRMMPCCIGQRSWEMVMAATPPDRQSS